MSCTRTRIVSGWSVEFEAWVDRLAETTTEEVDAHHSQGDQSAGEVREPCGAVEIVLDRHLLKSLYNSVPRRGSASNLEHTNA